MARLVSQENITLFCISSSVTPFVSGYANITTKNWRTIIAAKNVKGIDLDFAARIGKTPEINAFMIQCVKLPRL
jgi:hypothetical protein